MECPTGKKRHGSQSAAKRFRLAYTNGHRMRAYLCDACDGWHLTSDAVPYFKDRIRPRERRVSHGGCDVD